MASRGFGASGAVSPHARPLAAASPWLAALALLALGIPSVQGQPASSASAASAASAPEPSRAVTPASAASSRSRTLPPAPRGGSQSEAMHACRSLPGEQAQHECMLRHQAMPPYGEGAGSSGPPRRP
jgi:hypothetical protein